MQMNHRASPAIQITHEQKAFTSAPAAIMCSTVLRFLESSFWKAAKSTGKFKSLRKRVRQPVRVTEARVKNTQMSRLTGLVCPFWHSRLHRRQSATGQFLRSFHCFHRRYLTSRLLARTTDRRACAQDVSNCSTPHTCRACAAM